jgi:hypothetical protein
LAGIKLTRLFLQKRYEVIQVHNLPDFLVFCAVFPKIAGARVILDIHDVSPEFFANRAGRALDSWLVRLVIWQRAVVLPFCRSRHHCHGAVAAGRSSKRGVPPAKSSVVMRCGRRIIFDRPSAAAHCTGQGIPST